MKSNFEQEIRDVQDAASWKQKYQDLFYEMENLRDFMEWLFDNELDYTSFREMYEKFEKENPDDTSEELTIDKPGSVK